MARKVGLELADVVSAAAEVADTDGLEAVTLARVASALNVRAPSLYSHVEGLPGLRRELAVAAAGRMGAALAEAADGAHGADALRAVAYAYRRFALDHPGLYAAMLPTPDPVADEAGYQAFAEPVRVVAAIFAELGLADSDLVHGVRAFRSALHGFVSLHASGGFGLPEDVDESFDLLVDLVVAGVSRFGGSYMPIGG